MGKKLLISGVCLLALLWAGRALYVQYNNKLYNEYKRGLFTGASYYQRHGQYPSYWHWNHAYADENFNIDTVLKHDRIKEAKEELAWKEKIYKELGIDTILLPYRYHWHLSPDSVVVLGDPTWPGSKDITLPDNSFQFPDSLSGGSDESITTYQNSKQ